MYPKHELFRSRAFVSFPRYCQNLEHCLIKRHHEEVLHDWEPNSYLQFPVCCLRSLSLLRTSLCFLSSGHALQHSFHLHHFLPALLETEARQLTSLLRCWLLLLVPFIHIYTHTHTHTFVTNNVSRLNYKHLITKDLALACSFSPFSLMVTVVTWVFVGWVDSPWWLQRWIVALSGEYLILIPNLFSV